MASGLKTTVYDFAMPLLDGRTVQFRDFEGKVLLIVNTASKCGFTPQYAGLQQLYESYRDRGFAVLGFPCNQFGRQEPGAAHEIGLFCARSYEVTFPMFAKIDVNGPSAAPLYQFLKREQPGWLGVLGMNRIRWNFTKFLVDREGRVVARFGPPVAPAKLSSTIEDLLDG